jgi:hypothetical protein
MRRLIPLVFVLIAGCRSKCGPGMPTRSDSSVAALIEARVPAVTVADSIWQYALQVAADIDGDGASERVVVLSDVSVGRNGLPLWEDGHRWQVYVEESDSSRTYLYGRFLPNGRLFAQLVPADSGQPRPILLIEQMPDRWGAYEIRYRGPGQASLVERFVREIDARQQFDPVQKVSPPRIRD